MSKLTLEISGMSCGHCVGRVTQALAGVPGVQVEQVEVGKASLSWQPEQSSEEALRQAIDDVGFKVVSIQA